MPELYGQLFGTLFQLTLPVNTVIGDKTTTNPSSTNDYKGMILQKYINNKEAESKYISASNASREITANSAFTNAWTATDYFGILTEKPISLSSTKTAGAMNLPSGEHTLELEGTMTIIDKSSDLAKSIREGLKLSYAADGGISSSTDDNLKKAHI